MPRHERKERYIGPTRPMTREDMAATLGRSFVPTISAEKLRDSHHRVARLAAAGLRTSEVAAQSGYSHHRVWTLLQSPAMQELVAKYRGIVDSAFEKSQDEFFTLATTNMLKAERQIADRLDSADEDGPAVATRDLVAITADRADRFGYPKRQTNVNINADFAAQLEAAIARSSKVIEVESDQGKLRRRV